MRRPLAPWDLASLGPPGAPAWESGTQAPGDPATEPGTLAPWDLANLAGTLEIRTTYNPDPHALSLYSDRTALVNIYISTYINP